VQSPADKDLSHYGNTGRLEAFSDGVFAIAITLLVLEIAVPHLTDGESLARALGNEWPSFFGFALSFITIGIIWINHHELFRDIERADHTVVVLNLLILLCVAFIPFPTAVLAENLQDGVHRQTATLLYGGTYTVTAVFFVLLWLYVSSNQHLLDARLSPARIRTRTLRYLPGPLIYGLALVLALITPWLTLAIHIALAVLYLLPLDD
jgi:uncharacterized membrane protein